jgi:hypothetical protein
VCVCVCVPCAACVALEDVLKYGGPRRTYEAQDAATFYEDWCSAGVECVHTRHHAHERFAGRQVGETVDAEARRRLCRDLLESWFAARDEEGNIQVQVALCPCIYVCVRMDVARAARPPSCRAGSCPALS